jgi:hypothetical protein
MNNVPFYRKRKKRNTIESNRLYFPHCTFGDHNYRFVFVRRKTMWPYNHCEWKTITYGAGALKRAKQKIKDKSVLMVLSILPTILLVLGIIGLVK